MAKFMERVQNIFDDHQEARGRESTVGSHDARLGHSAEEERSSAQVSILKQNLLEDVKNRWVADLSSGVAPGVALSYAGGRIEQFNTSVAHRAAAIDIGALQAEVAAIAERLRAEHLRAVIQATATNHETLKEGQQESHNIRM